MPDYDAWDLTSDFTVAQASCLWCEVDSGLSLLLQKSQNPRVAAIEQMLVSEIRAGRLRADSTHNAFSSIGDYSQSLVSRDALIELAERKRLKPKFLFAAARQPSSEVQASAPLAPRDGSASTSDKSTSSLGRSVGQEGEIDFVPSGCIGLPGAMHSIWRALYGDAMDQPIPFWREEEQDGETVRIPTPEAAKKHKRIGRDQAGEAREMLLGGLADGQLIAEVDDANGTNRFTVPIWYWQSNRANMTISTGLLDLPTGSHSQFHLRTCFIWREAFHEWLHSIVGGAETEAERVATEDGKLIAEALHIVDTKESSSDRAEPDPHLTGYPGRPPKAKHLIEQEFRRRKDAGEVCPTLPEEADALLEWLEGEHPSAPPPTAKTIKNNIRDSYRRYEQKKIPTARN